MVTIDQFVEGIAFTLAKTSSFPTLRKAQSEYPETSSIWEGVRKNSYGVEALVDKLKMPKDYKTDMATLEEIIVFLSKGQEE